MRGESLLLNLTQEPPLGQVADNGQGEYKLPAADHSQSEECRSTHDLWIIEVSVERKT